MTGSFCYAEINGRRYGMSTTRSDRKGPHQRLYRTNRKKILMSESVCAICGRPVDMSLKIPDPMAPTVDHIIPVSKGGHPSDINNMQLAHYACNLMKSNRVIANITKAEPNKSIKLSCDWKNF